METSMQRFVNYLNRNNLLKLNELNSVEVDNTISVLLADEQIQIANAFNSGKANVFGKTCFLIKTGEEYFEKTFKKIQP